MNVPPVEDALIIIETNYRSSLVLTLGISNFPVKELIQLSDNLVDHSNI